MKHKLQGDRETTPVEKELQMNTLAMRAIRGLSVCCPSCFDTDHDLRGQNLKLDYFGPNLIFHCYAGCSYDDIRRAAKKRADANPVWEVIGNGLGVDALTEVYRLHPDYFREASLDNIAAFRRMRE